MQRTGCILIIDDDTAFADLADGHVLGLRR